VLSVVPLPNSLARFLDGAGVAAGGGAALGTSFLLKAAVAIVAAAFATGVGGDRRYSATAAVPPGAGFSVVRSSQGPEQGTIIRHPSGSGKAVEGTAPRKGSRAGGSAAQLAAGGIQAGQPTGTKPASASGSTAATAGHDVVSGAAAPVSGVTTTVEQAVESPTAALPVSAPSLPSTTVPSLPATTVPSLPTAPVVVPTVPLPPPPLPLP
jgi:hypothetical protein